MENLLAKSSIQIMPKEEICVVPQYIKNDVNLYFLPFFSNARWMPEAKDISLEIREEGRTLKWLVAPHQKWGSPAFFEKKVFYAFLSIIEEKGLPTPLVPFTFREISRRTGVAPTGSNIKNIKKAIERIIATRVKSEGIFYVKDKKTRIYDFFSIIDRVILKEETYTDPITEETKVAETNFLVLGSWLYSNLKNGYIAKIDYHLLQNMKPLEARLYEFLLPNFYPIVTGKSKDNFLKKSYSDLCKFLPTREYKHISQIKSELIVHIESLIKKGILSHYRVHRSENHKDFIFYFYPNTEEVKRKKLRRQQSIRFISDKPDKEALAQTLDKRVQALIDRGITESAAQTIVKDYPDNIKKQIDVFDWLKEKGDQRVAKSPAGYLRKSIEENYISPKGYKSKEERLKIEASRRETIEKTKLKAEKQKRHDEAVVKLNEKAKAFLKALPSKERITLEQQVLETIPEERQNFSPYVDTKILDTIKKEHFKKDLEHLAQLQIELEKE